MNFLASNTFQLFFTALEIHRKNFRQVLFKKQKKNSYILITAEITVSIGDSLGNFLPS